MDKYTKEDLKNDDSLIRAYAYRELGYTKEALKDKCWSIRLEAYEALGLMEESDKPKEWIPRIEVYINLGYTKEDLNGDDFSIEMAAHRYFADCMELLGEDEIVYEFTPEQAVLLELNGLKVNKLAIIGGK